jgi:hypothetical protein
MAAEPGNEPQSTDPRSADPRPKGPAPEVDHFSQAMGELGNFAARYRELEGRPPELLGALRQEAAFANAFARADCVTYLRKWFTPTDGWKTVEERSGASGGAGVAVEWSFEGRHDGDGTFNGLSPTGRPVHVKGVTMIGLEGSKLKLRRYVDWAGLFAQLGLTLNWRVPVDGSPPSGSSAGPPAGT